MVYRICLFHDIDFRIVVKVQKSKHGEALEEYVNLVPADPPYNISPDQIQEQLHPLHLFVCWNEGLFGACSEMQLSEAHENIFRSLLRFKPCWNVLFNEVEGQERLISLV